MARKARYRERFLRLVIIYTQQLFDICLSYVWFIDFIWYSSRLKVTIIVYLSGMDKGEGVHGLLSVPVSFIILIVNTMKNGKTNGGFRYLLRDGRMGKFAFAYLHFFK